ncbi:uncharacterized protein LOC105192650 [Harpegnathos saltator]|uniref:Uncharacterized protein n=1 Tax=Harpegnathos saltator TaxID=610380 RepID=E2B9Q5_HARSA|nr:uncharacterized protein LOC105192650 [Harpegnathos saltator]EFN87589.1 hypothetical protein EAI_07205 [Harpegnathos saltator]
MDENFVDPTGQNEPLPEDVKEKLSQIFEKYEQLTDEEKQDFQKGAFDVLTKSTRKLTGDSMLPTWLVPYQSYMLFIFAVVIVALLLVLVTRKLYKGMKERENRKEAKRRLKEQKAKKKRN